MLGRAIVWAVACLLWVGAILVAWNTPPLSGGTIAATVLAVLGFGLVARMVQVANREDGKR